MITAQTKHQLHTSKKLLPLAFLALVASYFLPTLVLAQTQAMTAIPPRVELSVNPGQYVQQVVQFKNDGDTTIYITAVTKDFIVQDTTGKPEFVTAQVSGRWSAASWMNISPSSFTVQPGAIADLVLSVNVPKDALPGGHYAGVLYQTAGQAIKLGVGTGAGSAVQQVVGSLVYLNVAGPITERAEVRTFAAPNFLEFGPVNFTTEIANMSDIHLSPQGTVTIRNMFGKNVATLQLNPDKRNVFPGTSFVFKNTWDTKYLLGRYRADLVTTYGSGGTLTATIYFLVFPVRIALAILLALVIVLLLVAAYRKHHQTQEETQVLEEESKEEPTPKK